MELLQLRYFCALAESQHLTNTASQLMISPPSLSLTISKLEKELGIPLFDRVKRNIRLNSNGECFYEKVKESLMLLDQATADMEHLRQSTQSTLLIALTSPHLWEDFFKSFHSACPNIKIITTVINLDELNDTIFPYDFFLGNGWDVEGDVWEQLQISKLEQSLILVSKSHPFATRKVINVPELQNETFITLGVENPTTDHFVHKLCHAYHFHPKEIRHANYFTRMREVHQNHGIVLISDLGLSKNFIDDGNIHKVKVNDSKVQRYQSINWRTSAVLSPAAKQFLIYAQTQGVTV